MDWGICRLMTQPRRARPRPRPPPRSAGASSPARTGSISRAEVSLEASHGETAYGAIVGTPLYMSPEQAHGRHDQLDAKSDQCALGLILFELVALKRPLGGKTLAEVLTQASSGTREPLVHAYGEAIPGELGAIIAKASAQGAGRSLRLRRRRSPTICAASCAATRCWRGPIRRGSAPCAALGRHRQAAALTLLGLVIAILAGDRGAAVAAGARARSAGAARPRDRAPRLRRRRAGRSPAGQPARSARRARHGGGGHRPRLRIRPALDGTAALGRRRARHDHRVRGGARRHPRAGRSARPGGSSRSAAR